MSWVIDEMSAINLGDNRLNQRAIKILSDMEGNPEGSIPTLCRGWHETKAAYRFFSNSKATKEKILEPHVKQTIRRIKEKKRVLLIQDTTELNYHGQRQKQDVGPSHHEKDKVLFFHPMLAVTTDKLPLGIIDIQTWHREHLLSKKYSIQERNNILLHKKDISEKESFKWLQGYRNAKHIAQSCTETHIVMVADREADIADIYHEHEQTTGVKPDWLIRCKVTKRAIMLPDGTKDSVSIKEKLLATRPEGYIEFELPRRDGNKARRVKQSIRIIRVKGHPPTGRRGKLRLKPYWITAILAKEEEPPKGEKAVEWLLLTSIELNDEIKPHDIIKWYLCRWQIEVFFYVLKSGCNAEANQLKCADRFLPCLAMYSIVAWRILMMTFLGRLYPDITCEILFTKEEWHCIYTNTYRKKPPCVPITLHEAIICVAKAGGFLARKTDGFPGPQKIWMGLNIIRDQMAAIENYKESIAHIYG